MKIHLIESDEPIKSGETVKVACGEDVPNAELRFMFDYSEHGVGPVNRMLICTKCYQAPRTRQHYMSGVVNAQEMKLER